jgi:hypothetical protein
LVAFGDLRALKQLPAPSPALYLLSFNVEVDGGPLADARWILIAPWRTSVYTFEGDRARADWEWQKTLGGPPTAELTRACLSFDSTTRGHHPAAADRPQSFGVVAQATLGLTPGTYRLTLDADDGVRAWLGGGASNAGEAGITLRAVVNAWDGERRVTRDATFNVDHTPPSVRVEFFQWNRDYALHVQCRPDSPAADAWVTAVLGGEGDDLRHWLTRDGMQLELSGHPREAGRRYSAALAMAHGGFAAGEEEQLLDGLARTSEQAADYLRAAEYFHRLATLRAARCGPDNAPTRKAIVAEARNLDAARTAEGPAMRRAAAEAEASDLDGQIADLSRLIKEYPEYLGYLRQRCQLYGRRGRTHEASADNDALLKLSPSEPNLLYRGAILRLAEGDEPGYRRQCEELVRRFGTSLDAGTMRRVVKSCCLSADPVGGADEMLRIAEAMYIADPKNFWSTQVLALACYRAGRFARAAELLESGRADENAGAAINDVIRAMALAGIGDHVAAHRSLESARQAMANARLPKLQTVLPEASWHDWLACRILADQAEALIRCP